MGRPLSLGLDPPILRRLAGSWKGPLALAWASWVVLAYGADEGGSAGRSGPYGRRDEGGSIARYEERPVVDEVAEPEVRGPQDVVIRVGGAGLCRTDLHIVEGQWAEKSWRSVQAMYLLFRAVDRRESKRELAATSQLARVANLLTR